MKKVRKHERRNILRQSRADFEQGLITEAELDSLKASLCSPKEFPKEHEARISVLLSVVNIEPKQITTMLLDDKPKSMGDLRADFIDLTGGIWTSKALSCHIESYLSDNFYPAGLVRFHPIDINDGTVRIEASLTAPGIRYAQPFAAFALNMANRFDTSLYQIFGTANTKYQNTESPENRLRILDFLLNSKDVRIADIQKRFELEEASITRHLEELDKIGFIKYEHIGRGNRWAVYKWKKGSLRDVRSVHRQRGLTDIVSRYLYEHKEANRYEIADYMVSTGKFDNYQYKTLLHWVSNILSGLMQQDFASAYFNQTIRSHASITNLGREFTDEFSRKLSSLVDDGEELRGMQELFEEYAHNETLLRMHAKSGLGSYNSVRPSSIRRTQEQWNDAILEYLRGRDEKDINSINSYFGKRINHQLRRMYNKGLLMKETKKRVDYYCPNPFRPFTMNKDVVDKRNGQVGKIISLSEEYVTVFYGNERVTAHYPFEFAKATLDIAK